jgi:hypothetical protein
MEFNKYDIDFPETGDLNWKTVKIITPNISYLNGKKIIGVVLHDGKFIVNGVCLIRISLK